MAKKKAQANSGFVPLAVPHLGGNEWAYVKECLDTNWVSSAGSFVTRFEAMMAEYIGVDHAVATTSGTAALHVAMLAAGVGADDEVVVPTLTFIAPANAVRYVGAWPVFVDAEANHWQMDPAVLADFLENGCQQRDGRLINKSSGRRVKAILPVHLLGHPCDMDPILELAHRYDLVVVEDATESLGAKYKGRMVGNLGDIACFSFNGNKMITTGGGGMIVTGNQEWADRAANLTTQAKDDPVEYIHHEIGFNYRLTNIQAALGCAQLEQLEQHLASKRKVAERYNKQLSGIAGLTSMSQASWAESASWMFTLLVDREVFMMDSRALLSNLAEQGMQARPLFQPLHLSAAHEGSQVYQYGVAESVYRDAISLPCSVGMEEDELDRVCRAIQEIWSNSSGVPST